MYSPTIKPNSSQKDAPYSPSAVPYSPTKPGYDLVDNVLDDSLSPTQADKAAEACRKRIAELENHLNNLVRKKISLN